jgi:hypothetical protein
MIDEILFVEKKPHRGGGVTKGRNIIMEMMLII